MEDNIWTSLGAMLAALFAGVYAWWGKRKTGELKREVNGRMSELLAEAKRSAYLRGYVDGRMGDQPNPPPQSENGVAHSD